MKKDDTFYDIYCAYKVTTTSDGIRALWDWLGIRNNVPLEISKAKITMKDAWVYLDDFLRYEMIERGETITLTNMDTMETLDIYDWLWDQDAYQELMQYFPYDFLCDVRAMPEDEFKELFW